MNSLLGVLMRFRRENYAIMCDIEQMFFSFHVNPEHRDFLRFLWFRENNPKQPIIEYRMNVHLFGNGPSPAIATFGLRKTVDGEEKFDTEVKNFVCREFYVDDGLCSKRTAREAINLVRDTQAALATANLRLHKVVSNSVEVMEAFPVSLLRCDRGTNFVGGKSELDDALREMDQRKIDNYLSKQGCKWEFNPPHASHFGGAWERQIRTIRQVLNAMFAELGTSQLTHELLVTLMAEVAAIVNACPIAAVPSDVDEPQPLSPAMLLTMKTRPLGPPPGKFVPTDLYARRRWRRVQYLADQFWLRWKREYLQSLQPRKKWQEPRRDLADGDIVLVREEDQHRNDWPLGRVTAAKRSQDGRVRSAEVAVLKDGKSKTVQRPVKELVLLVPTSRNESQRVPTE